MALVYRWVLGMGALVDIRATYCFGSVACVRDFMFAVPNVRDAPGLL